MREGPLERLTRTQRRLAPGSFGGRIESVAPGRAERRFDPWARGLPDFFFPYHHTGPLSSTVSDRFYPYWTSTLFEVFVSLSTVGSSSSVLTVYRNAVSLGTVTLVASAATASTTFSSSFTAKTDYLTMAFTTLGTGAAGAVAQAMYRRAA